MKTPANLSFEDLARIAAKASRKANEEAVAAGIKVEALAAKDRSKADKPRAALRKKHAAR